jgi:dTDP-4-dehydrorhamnose 3,5-epimerase
LDIKFVQDNHSLSKYGVLRGLHFQEDPYSQGKLVRVTKGEVFDVAVDVRKDSKNYGKWTGKVLSDKNKLQLWIPEGFAHGYLVLSDLAEFQYKTTSFYNSEHERCIIYNDPVLNIEWPKLDTEYILSKKDLDGKFFKTY